MESPIAVRRVDPRRSTPVWRRTLESAAAVGRSPGQRRVALALGLALAGVLSFARIAEDYLTNDPLARWDVSFARWLSEHRSGVGIDVLRAVTVVGSPVFALALGTLVCVALYRRRRLADAALLPLVLGGVELLNLVLKLAFRRDRPEVGFVQLETFSFPSGHAMISAASWGTLAFLAWGRLGSRGGRARLLAATFALVSLICFSRLYLGVHYLSDVLAGVSGGVAWLGLSLAAHAAWGERVATRLDGSRVDRVARRLTRT